MNLSDGLVNAIVTYLSRVEAVQLITAIQSEAKQQPKKDDKKEKKGEKTNG